MKVCLLWALFLALGTGASKAQTFTCSANGLFADPANCAKFYQCANGVAYPFTCGSGLMFDTAISTCNYEYNVNCGSRPKPGTGNTTTTKTTTTTTTKTTTTTTTKTTSTTTTTKTSSTTTTKSGQPTSRLPKKVIGYYILLADESYAGFTSDSVWTPKLHDYQTTTANVLFFSFINPNTMKVPKAFENLAKSRGSTVPGSVKSNQKIIFAIGGQAYSLNYIPWPWLASPSAAEAMASEVATWPEKYGCDGIDLDIEQGAGDLAEAGPNMIVFLKKLRQLKPNIIIAQPTYGFPQVPAENDVINASWNVDTSSNNLADSIGLMVYEGSDSLKWVKSYAQATQQWAGFPIRVNVPKKAIILGAKGVSAQSDILKLANESVAQDLMGIMVWFASVQNGFSYDNTWDLSVSQDTIAGFQQAMNIFAPYL